eukprot:TRINITY_DN2648_c1_g1_i1.p1 TRINITY_DN2648_c1_g1~~TRINITY_DN2648_c1_g1_i1.p1  ORF type:complete len:426 (+),score=117.56 TRINITY_DN2648_c1_g1_i1:183-1280(+)
MKKYMATLFVDRLNPTSYSNIPPIISDFRKLRSDLLREGRFSPNLRFFFLQLVHIISLEFLALWMAVQFGDSWKNILIISMVLAVSQSQAGWTQHDYGHLSVFGSNLWLHRFFHVFTIGILKGASAEWWKTRHNRHHAKTNVIDLDPDIHTEPLFVWSEKLLKRGWKHLPYQHLYWWLIGPPMVTTVIFLFQNIRYVATYKIWRDAVGMILYFSRFGLTYGQIFCPSKAIALYFMMRFWESHWFTWVTSMSHLPRPIFNSSNFQLEKSVQLEFNLNWVSGNAFSTQNITAGLFHDWFTGHLNFQLEHHLFPSMPRHHLSQVSERVKNLCEKHGVPYHRKTMYECCCDVVRKLQLVAHFKLKEFST